MGGFLGIGNSSAKTDRGNQLGGINAEWNVYNRGLPMADANNTAGTATTGAGISGIDAAKAFFQKISGGDRAATMEAAAPAIGAVQDQSGAHKSEEAALGTGRTGGAVAANEQAQSKQQTDINNIIAGEAPQAASEAGKLGTAEAGVGQSQMMSALRALGLSDATASEIIDSSIKSRPISEQANAAVRQQWSQVLDGILGGFGGGGATENIGY